MKKFILGMAAMYTIDRNLHRIVPSLQAIVAKLELQRDILIHDNPDLEK